MNRLLSEVGAERLRTELRRRDLADGEAAQGQSIEASRVKSRTLAGFIREAWHVVEPGTPLVWGWHIEAICQHLEAVTYGKISRVLINVPPGTMKSLIVSVFWPAWEWGPCGMPHLRYYTTSFKDELVTRDTRKMRDLVFSDWYQARWGHLVKEERGGEKNFSNDRQGWRIGSAWTSLTGERGHRLIIDDPHSTEQAESEAERKRAVRIFRESAPSRIVDPQTSAIIIVMQRLHVNDISGVALAVGGYVHLMLPMEFEEGRRCETSIGWRDPRTYEGELLFPERFSREVVERDKAIMGTFAVAGQYQQRPTPREGALFRREWFRVVKAAPAGVRWVRYWDLAATADQMGADPAYTAGVKLGRTADGRYIIGDVNRLRAEGTGVRRMMRDTARDDGPHCEIGFPQDPGQAGKVQAQDLVAMLPGYIARYYRETGDKLSRADPVAAQAEAGNISLVEGSWNDAFIDEAVSFPGGKFKDQIDALSGAFAMLIGTSVFGVPEEFFTIEGGPIPSTWSRAAAVVVSNSAFTAVWGAIEPVSRAMIIYDTLHQPRQHMAVHARALAERGKWVPVLFHPEGLGRSKAEGVSLAQDMADHGIDLLTMPYSLEAAVPLVADRLSTAKIRVFQHLTAWFAEYRRVTRDEKGEIDESQIAILSATGLLITSGEDVAITESRAKSDDQGLDVDEWSRLRNENATGY